MKFVRYSNILRLLCIGIGLNTLLSCNDKWDDHFHDGQTDNRKSLTELLGSNSNLSRFEEMVKLSGYDKLLSASQAYTVWAPANDALADIDMTNIAEVKRIVENHIGRFTYPSPSEEMRVRTINGKRHLFSPYEGGIALDEVSISQQEQLANNGLLYEIESRIPYKENLHEYISKHNEYSELNSFLSSFQEVIFDPSLSTEIDIDDAGRPVYDSVMVDYNILLQHPVYGLGNILSEDSTYTMLIPDNEAWQNAYQRIFPYFAVYNSEAEYADSVQDIRTKLAIVQDLIVRGNIDIETASSVSTTSGSEITNIADLYKSSAKIEMSNGIGFSSDNLAYNNTETWSKPIKVEGEEQEGRSYNNTQTSIYTRVVPAESPFTEVSGDSYIEVQPISNSINPTVVFELPEVLAGKYNIYVTFVPAAIEGEEMANDSTKMSFTLSYQNEKGQIRTTSNRNNNLVTSGSKMVTLLAFEAFEFPVSNYHDFLYKAYNGTTDIETTTLLSVATNVTAADFNKGTYTRRFRLDRIILEPIKLDY